jgi:hypothetical protein
MRIPSKSNLNYLPLMYFLPQDMIEKCPTLRALPRCLGEIARSDKMLDLIDMQDNKPQNSSKYNELELPQSVIDSFARFLVPEIRKYYESEQRQREFAEWQEKQEATTQKMK